MSQPSPVVLADSRAETMEKANIEPVMKSTIDRPKRTGGPSGSPVMVMKPASACIR